ncbi:MAG: hypothetical protein M5U29_07790 [Anaerolineae bacterium]|nr:hypothetical protein [Anaerolineae bacterium]
MNRRTFGSLLVGLLLGLSTGVFLGWGPFPVEYKNSALSALAPHYQEEYTVMVAEGYRVDADVNAALERLRPLGKENTIAYVIDLTERYISQSNIRAIPIMVALVEAIIGPDNLPAVMQLYRPTPTATSSAPPAS